MNSTVAKAQPFRSKLILFLELCSLDMKVRTAGTAFGFIWLYLNPLISIAVIWSVFHFGLKATSSNSGSTYTLLVSLMAWYFIQDLLISGMGAITEKPYLVKKIKFPTELLPLIKVVNSFRIHLPFLALTILFSVLSGHFSWIGLFQFFVSLPLIMVFLTSVVFLLSTAVVFYRDIQSIVTMIMQLVFWATPIIWTVPETPRIVGKIESLNPIYYILKVYRYCFLGQESWDPISTFLFFLFLVVFVILARRVFNTLKEQFADVL